MSYMQSVSSAAMVLDWAYRDTGDACSFRIGQFSEMRVSTLVPWLAYLKDEP